MAKIRPFMDKDIVKVLTGIRRCGKSVMMQLIQEELAENGVDRNQIFSVNFETKSVDYVQNAGCFQINHRRKYSRYIY